MESEKLKEDRKDLLKVLVGQKDSGGANGHRLDP